MLLVWRYKNSIIMSKVNHFLIICRRESLNSILPIFFIVSCGHLWGQNAFTPYDELPCIQANIKPALDSSMPRWAKMLYEYPVNYQEILEARKDTIIVKSSIERYFKVWQKCIVPYTDAEGHIILTDIELLNEEIFNEQVKSTIANKGMSSHWTFVGPKETFWLNEAGSSDPPEACPWQVNVYSFDIALTNNSVLYAGTETGFMNKSIDNGQSWQFIAKDYFFGGGITAVAIHPENEDIVYASAGNQMHKTIDGGVSWRPLLGADRFYADRIRIDPNNSDKVIAASSKGIYISYDGGLNWSRKFKNQAWDVRIHPKNSNILYAITTDGSDFRCVISQDGGENFNASERFLGNIRQTDGAMMAVSSANPDLVWVVLLSENNTPYLLKGEWAGNQLLWETLAVGRTSQLRMNNGQGYFDLVLDVSPEDENTIYVGTTTLYMSDNGGISFRAVGGYEGPFAIHPDIQDIKILDKGQVWVATDGGMNFSSDNFNSSNNYRASVKGLVGSDFWGFDQGWAEDIVVGGRYHNGNTSIADFYGDKALRMGGAESPTGWVLKGKSRHVAFDDLGNGWILPKSAEGRPEGRFIFSKHPNMDEYGGRRSNIIHHPQYFGTVYLGEGNGFWRSEDGGVNWELLFTFPARVRYLINSPSDGDIIYCDVVGLGLFRSEDGGATFEHKSGATSPEFGGSYWAGKLHFDISPSHPNTLYLCQQNGTWSADKGRILVSYDGGDNWENWTDNIDEYLKSILIQKGKDEEDIVYLFTNAKNNLNSKVYYRSQQMLTWQPMDTEYPSGMQVNSPKLFYRDSKIRVSGNAGVWEHPFLEMDYEPMVRPWVENKVYNCFNDTVYFNDYSIIDYEDVKWQWTITPAPLWIDNAFIRNPKVVFGKEGRFDVELTLIKDGKSYSKTINEMVTTKTCPSIEDCSNPDYLPKNEWKLISASSEEINDPGLAVMSFDNDPSTIWHTRWSTGSDPYPHEIVIDLGGEYEVSAFEYLTRQEGVNGRIKSYELSFSDTENEWPEPIKKEVFVNTSAPQKVQWEDKVKARYMKLRALSEVNDGPWASAAELSVIGCKVVSSSQQNYRTTERLRAFPVPSTGLFTIEVPHSDINSIQVFNIQGIAIDILSPTYNGEGLKIDLNNQPSGFYFVKITTQGQKSYHVKLVKD